MDGYGISLFGDLRVTYGEDPLTVGGARQRSLLALLAINANLTLTPDRIIDELWGDEPPGRPSNAIRFHLSKLRSQLTPEGEDRTTLIDTLPGGYALSIDPENIDAVRYEGLIVRAEALLGLDPTAAMELSRDADALASGPPLAEFHYDEFARAFIARTDLVLRRGRSVAIDVAIARGDDDEATARIRSALEDDPYDESLYRRLMLVQYRSGRSTEALATYKEVRSRLGEDLGLEPSPDLADLEEQILLHTVAPSVPARSGRLPAEVTSVIGRTSLLEQATELLAANRWVALTGLPGSGKSRLALRVAHEAGSAVWFEVPATDQLSELRTALRSAIQRSFPHIAVDATDPLAAIGSLETLIVFDGMQRSAAAPDLIEEVLDAGEGLSVMTTTHTPARRRDEWVLTVPALEHAAARELMRDRLGRDPSISDLDLLESTGGLPGMIETAAVADRIRGAEPMPLRSGSLVDYTLAALPKSVTAAVPNLSLLQPPFDVVDAGIAIGGDAEHALDGLSILVDSGIVVTTGDGLAVHPLLRNQILDALDRFDVEEVLRFIAEHADRVALSDRAVLHALDAARGGAMEAELDAALAALTPVWWNLGPRRGRSALLRPDAWDTFPPEDPRTDHLLYLATHLSLTDNDVPQAVDFVHRHATASESGGPSATSRHDQLLGHLALFTGDLPSAIDALRRAARTAMDADLPSAAVTVASLGFVELASATGDPGGHSDRVLLTAAGRSQAVAQPLAAELNGHRAWFEGNLDAADAHLSQAVSGYLDLAMPAWAGPATALLAIVACHRGDPDRASALLAGASGDEDVAVVAARSGAREAFHGDRGAAERALASGARSLANGTNPIWTYRLLAAAMHAARALPEAWLQRCPDGEGCSRSRIHGRPTDLRDRRSEMTRTLR